MKFRLDMQSGVPVYRQIIDQVHAARASGAVRPGDQLPTVRQLAVDLAINPNTVVRAYRELELTGALTTHQGTGTFHHQRKSGTERKERDRKLDQFVADLWRGRVAKDSRVKEVRSRLKEFVNQENGQWESCITRLNRRKASAEQEELHRRASARSAWFCLLFSWWRG